jgi:SAM-dependent methyltransferase
MAKFAINTPIKKFIEKIGLKSYNKLVSSSIVSKIIVDTIQNAVSISAKLDPKFNERQAIWVLSKSPDRSDTMGVDEYGFPIPPFGLWGANYDDRNPQNFVDEGKILVKKMREVLEASNFQFESGYRILELGCRGGRMIRHLKDISDICEIWGADLGEDAINWCQRYLSPPFKFVSTTSFPHLPFQDNYFDFIYAGSVFTHISVLSDMWLLELKRILRPGGRIYITIHDRRSIEANKEGKFSMLAPYLSADFEVLTVQSWGYQRGFDPQVFYDIDFLCSKWSQMLDIISVTPAAWRYQTAILLSY